MKSQKMILYYLVLFLSLALMVIALGGGIWGQGQPWQFQWQHSLFQHFCHQIPDRSFDINRQPMAVCSRCLGIYTGWSLGWILLPILNILRTVDFNFLVKILVGIVLVNLVDISGDFINYWENTLTSRLVLGMLLGSAAAMLFTGEFINKK
jgi:uncharacterized membrane protein